MEECLCPVLVVADMAAPAAVIAAVPVAEWVEDPVAWAEDPWVVGPLWADITVLWGIVLLVPWDIALPLPVPEEAGA